MKAIYPIILVVAGIVFAYLGITTFQGSSADVEVLGLEIGAADEGAQTTAILYGVLSLLCFALLCCWCVHLWQEFRVQSTT